MAQPRRRPSTWLSATLVTLPFIAVLAYFHWVDVYDLKFFTAGVTLPYNLCRLLFIIYLFAAICVPGYAALSAIGGAATFTRLRPLERLAAAFFCGAALWHALLLGLGFLDLYVYPVAVALSVPAVALSAVYLRGTVCELCRGARATLRLAPPTLAWTTLGLAVLALAAALLLLVVKGLFPTGGHDYFNHYHGYYESVLRNHGVWPNEVWYHFYYSKGMGLFFLGSMLTDPLAPSLVTYCFAIGTAMALFLLIDRMSVAANFWPWIAVIAYFVLYTYTPGIDVYLLNGGWADFEKPHEIDSAFVIGFIWLCAGLRGAVGRERRIWFFAAAACVFIVSIIELVTVLLLGLFMVILTAFALVRRRGDDAKAFFALSVVGGCGLVAICALNYLVTGLPSDQFAPQAWPWANVQTLYKWGALPYVIFLMRGLAGLHANGIHWLSWQFITFFHDVLRIDLLKPLLIKTPIFLVLVAGTVAWRIRRARGEQDAAPLGLLVIFVAALAAAAAVAGVDQKISFYRYTSFCLPVVIGVAGCGWLYIAAPIRIAWLNAALRYVLPVIVLAGALSQFYINQSRFLKQVVPHALAFADGSTSIRQAYADQQGWAGRHTWGGILPGMVGAWRVAGPGTRIWSMHLAAYCMLPHCRSETFFSFILSPHLLDMLAGSAEETRDIMQREGLNYFFYTREMDMNDILPVMKPFAPDRIADYIGIKWTDGTSFLLTWLGPGVTPLTPEWVAQYKKAVETAPYEPAGFPTDLLLDVRKQLQASPRWGRELKLPGITSN